MDKKNIDLIEKDLLKFQGYSYQIIIKDMDEDIDNKLLKNINFLFKSYVEKGNFFILKDNQNKPYKIEVLEVQEVEKNNFKYTISITNMNNSINVHKKNKYKKNIYIENKKHKYINDIGIINAQKAHAQDVVIDQYIKLYDYLKENKFDFLSQKLYIKNNNDEYIEYRHKNLFSEYKDEISDFEKITYIKREEPQKISLSFKLDDDILNYDQSKVSLLDRKNARVIAKAIYNNNGEFFDKEFLNITKDIQFYINDFIVLSANEKNVYDKIEFKDMNINSLKKEFIYEYKNKFERKKNIQLKFLSKRNKKRKKRRDSKIYIKEGYKEYSELK